jgi:hypothetical protein
MPASLPKRAAHEHSAEQPAIALAVRDYGLSVTRTPSGAIRR